MAESHVNNECLVYEKVNSNGIHEDYFLSKKSRVANFLEVSFYVKYFGFI